MYRHDTAVIFFFQLQRFKLQSSTLIKLKIHVYEVRMYAYTQKFYIHTHACIYDAHSTPPIPITCEYTHVIHTQTPTANL